MSPARARHSAPPPRLGLSRYVRDNGLTLVLGAIFLASLAGHVLSGWSAHNADLAERGRTMLGLPAYLGSGAFLSSLFENWESEFLQMAAYVVLTAILFQRGSAESRDPDAPDDAPGDRPRPGLAGWIHAHLLGLALVALFLLCFLLHWVFSTRDAMEEAAMNGLAGPASMLDHLFEARFWFESFQNWQSEFLSTAVLVVLTIVLRQRGSPESKPLDAPRGQTGK
ncbi:DUF6766 family protein [Aquabacter spiritensis]|uniref:Transmembrane protein n=1 Tax=Aquabacter spiritensis TaxID=933073 RepID=A0A4R3LRL6_9HYPH|nr:DUF6766 family protein [Aquabacter spiritensis]TCT02386.1 hypothetical protein EDC64_11332 [Aquabacter spiritensis]